MFIYKLDTFTKIGSELVTQRSELLIEVPGVSGLSCELNTDSLVVLWHFHEFDLDLTPVGLHLRLLLLFRKLLKALVGKFPFFLIQLNCDVFVLQFRLQLVVYFLRRERTEEHRVLVGRFFVEF